MEATLNGPFGQTTLGPGAVTIGRAADNQLSLNDTQASSHHAEIRPEGQGYVLIDRGSTNGTFVNEQRVDSNVPRLLNAGDRIRVGGTVFTYETSGGSFADKTILAGGSDKTAMASPPDFGAMPAQNYQQPQNYSQQPPPYQQPPQGYPQQPPAYPQQPLQGYPQQPSAYPPQPPQGYPQQLPVYPQQPSFPGQSAGQVPGALPGYQQPVARKKGRGGCVIAAVVVLVLLLAGVAFAYFNIPSVRGLLGGSTPDKTVQTYCNAIKNKDAPTAYNQLSKHAQSQISEQQFAQIIQLVSTVGGISSCSTSNVQITGSTATVDVTTTTGDGKTHTTTDKMVLEDGVWKLDGSNTVTQPS